MTEPNVLEIERLAIRLCEASGRSWKQPRTRRAEWREKAGRILEASNEPIWQRIVRWWKNWRNN